MHMHLSMRPLPCGALYNATCGKGCGWHAYLDVAGVPVGCHEGLAVCLPVTSIHAMSYEPHVLMQQVIGPSVHGNMGLGRA